MNALTRACRTVATAALCAGIAAIFAAKIAAEIFRALIGYHTKARP